MTVFRNSSLCIDINNHLCHIAKFSSVRFNSSTGSLDVFDYIIYKDATINIFDKNDKSRYWKGILEKDNDIVSLRVSQSQPITLVSNWQSQYRTWSNNGSAVDDLYTVKLQSSQNQILDSINVNSVSDNSRRLILQLKENLVVAILPKTSDSDNSDHHF
jgi:hypothetical protein